MPPLQESVAKMEGDEDDHQPLSPDSSVQNVTVRA